MKRWWIRLLVFPLLMLVGICGWVYIVRPEPSRFGAGATPEQQTAPVLVYGYVVTFVGVVIGSAYRELQARKQRGLTRIESVGEFVKSVFMSLDFWMSLCGSPLVYALLWRSADGGNVAGLTTIALQNGFCCTVIISSLMAKPPEPATSGS